MKHWHMTENGEARVIWNGQPQAWRSERGVKDAKRMLEGAYRVGGYGNKPMPSFVIHECDCSTTVATGISSFVSAISEGNRK